MTTSSTVFVIDDELQVRQSLRFLLSMAGYETELYASAEDYLECRDPKRYGCLLLDVRMSGINGLELQEQLLASESKLPIIVMSGYANTPTIVRAMKNGAIDFLEKPFDDRHLLQKIEEAIERGRQQWLRKEQHAMMADRVSLLSPREREVMDLLVLGKTTKEIAAQLVISTKTVDVHRARVLQKMQVDNVVELVVLLSELN